MYSVFKIGERFLRSPYAIVLAPLSWIWRLGMYFRSLRKVHRVSVPVVSIGNIAVGGTGKTPLVIYLAQQFSDVAILSRGYGGDEMQLLRKTGAKCYEGKDRVQLAELAVKEGAKLILLDDGFQYRRLHRDLDIVLINSEDTRVMPSGMLREPQSALKRADVVLTLEPKVSRVVDLAGREVSLKGERVGIFCGIARPERFKKTVEKLGAQIVFTQFLADHEPVKNLKSLRVKYLVCTEKDAVKLPPTDLPIVIVEIAIEAPYLVAKIAEMVHH